LTRYRKSEVEKRNNSLPGKGGIDRWRRGGGKAPQSHNQRMPPRSGLILKTEKVKTLWGKKVQFPPSWGTGEKLHSRTRIAVGAARKKGTADAFLDPKRDDERNWARHAGSMPMEEQIPGARKSTSLDSLEKGGGLTAPEKENQRRGISTTGVSM